MKRLIVAGVLCFGLGQMTAMAQSRGYQDDIYYNSSDAQKEAERQAEQEQRYQRQKPVADTRGQENTDAYDDGGDYTRTYDSDDYIDYDDDQGVYATNIRRFNYPFYNMGYYSAFYNPYWYNPYWVDPYGGWSWWGRPGIGVSFGFGGGPYWSSYWGWHSWYGYPAFYGGYGYGGYGGYGGWGGGYYSGYWNGYYAGLYNHGGYGNYGGRSVTYGPRYSLNSNYNSPRSANAGRTRTTQNSGGMMQQAPVSGSFQRVAPAGRTMNQQGGRRTEMNTRSPETVAPGGNGGVNGRQPASGRGSFIREDGNRNAPANNNNPGNIQAAPQQRSSPARRMNTPSQQMNQQQMQVQPSQPRMSTPQRSGGNGGGTMFRGGSSGGGRSFGGGTSGGGGRSSGGGSGGRR